MNFVKKIIGLFWHKLMPWQQFIKFSAVGALNTAVDFGVYFTLTRLIFLFQQNYLLANALAFLAAVTNSYFLNKYWTFAFNERGSFWKQYGLFFITSLFTLTVLEIILYYLIERLDIYDLFAKVLLIIISVVLNFFFSKFIVFKKAL